jgi:hypothetical protein
VPGGQHFDGFVFLLLDLLNLLLSLFVHVLSEQLHLILVLVLDFIGNSLVLLSDSSRLLVLFLCKSIKILSVSDVLLLVLNFK